MEFRQESISAHGGIEVIRRYLRGIDFARRVRVAFRSEKLDGDYGVAGMLLTVVALILVGGFRVSHVAFLGQDPLVLRFCGLQRLPSDRTVARWLKRFGSTAVLALRTLVRDVVHDEIERSGLRSATLDVDGTVLRTGRAVAGTARGFNPHHPKDPSYYPLTIHVAETGQILDCWNRPGNVNDSHNAVGVLRSSLRDLRERFPNLDYRVRMDGAFFLPEVLRFLDDEADVGWSVKVPLWKWLGLREQIATRQTWTRVSNSVEGFTTAVCFGKERWPAAVRVVVYRKRVFHRTAKNFQLDLFDPADGTYEYSAIATNLDYGVARLWHFMAGRGAHEKTLAELKQDYSFASIPTNDRQANSAWQLISVLALNLVRSFQIELGAPRRPRTRKWTYLYRFQSLRTLRFEMIHQPVRVVRPRGRTRLRYAAAPAAAKKIRSAFQSLGLPSKAA